MNTTLFSSHFASYLFMQFINSSLWSEAVQFVTYQAEFSPPIMCYDLPACKKKKKSFCAKKGQQKPRGGFTYCLVTLSLKGLKMFLSVAFHDCVVGVSTCGRDWQFLLFSSSRWSLNSKLVEFNWNRLWISKEFKCSLVPKLYFQSHNVSKAK